jgi:hypothetical protein
MNFGWVRNLTGRARVVVGLAGSTAAAIASGTVYGVSAIDRAADLIFYSVP